MSPPEQLPLWALELLIKLFEALAEDEQVGRMLRLAEQAVQRGNSATRWLDSFPASYRKVERRPPPTLADCSPLDPALAVQLLGNDGALAQRIPNYEVRKGQLMMVERVVAAFNDGQHLIVEAGTGIGKSLGYLLPALLWAQLNDTPVVVSTNTRNLQTQLTEKDLPLVQALLSSLPATGATSGAAHRPLRTALIKGRGNYLCLRRFAELLELAPNGLQTQEQRQLALLLPWAATTPDGDLDTFQNGPRVDPGFTLQLNTQAEECPGPACRHYRRCFVQKARERSLSADVVVANHALLFSELGTASPVALPRHAQVVFDEAHNLEEAATRHFSIELSPLRCRLAVRRLASGRGRRRRGLLATLRRTIATGTLRHDPELASDLKTQLDLAGLSVTAVRNECQQLCRRLHALLPADGTPLRFSTLAEGGSKGVMQRPQWQTLKAAKAEVDATIADLIAQLKLIVDLLLKAADDELNLLSEETSDLNGAITLLETLRHDIDFVLAGGDSEFVYWIQRTHGQEGLAEAWAAPLKVGPLLAANLFAARESVILCSATLSVGGKFNYIGERLGLDLIEPERLATCIAPSPFDYHAQCALLAPTYLAEPNDPDRSYVSELAMLVHEVATHIGGRTLCLFTSYEMLRHCARLIEAALKEADIDLLIHGESGSRDQLLRAFRADRRSVLFGTHSFWEGVDVVGAALSCVIVARLPFASPGDPLISARCEQIDLAGGSSFKSLALPAAVLRLRQGFGRLIRHRHDRGLVIVADSRILSKSYGVVFRRNLPALTQSCDSNTTLLAYSDRHFNSGESAPPSPAP